MQESLLVLTGVAVGTGVGTGVGAGANTFAAAELEDVAGAVRLASDGLAVLAAERTTSASALSTK